MCTVCTVYDFKIAGAINVAEAAGKYRLLVVYVTVYSSITAAVVVFSTTRVTSRCCTHELLPCVFGYDQPLCLPVNRSVLLLYQHELKVSARGLVMSGTAGSHCEQTHDTTNMTKSC